MEAIHTEKWLDVRAKSAVQILISRKCLSFNSAM